jgi:hypothetical protein
MISIFAFLVKYIILGFTIFNILVLLTNNFIIKNIIKKMPQIEPIKYPVISILVPARNEEKTSKSASRAFWNRIMKITNFSSSMTTQPMKP